MGVESDDRNELGVAGLVGGGSSARSAFLSRRALFGLIVWGVLLVVLGGCRASVASSLNGHRRIDHRPARGAAPHLAHDVHVAWPYFRARGDGWLLGETGCLGVASASCLRACLPVQSIRVGGLGWQDSVPHILAGSDNGLLLSAADTVTLLVTPPHESGTAQYLYRSGDGLTWRRIGGPVCPAKHNALAVVTGSGQAPDGSYAITCTDATLRILSAHGAQIGATHRIPPGPTTSPTPAGC